MRANKRVLFSLDGARRQTHTYYVIHERLIRLLPAPVHRLLGFVFLAVGGTGLVAGLYSLSNDWAVQGWVLTLGGSLFFPAGLMTLAMSPGYEFDRAAGLLRQRALLRRGSWPLAAVAAVQLAPGATYTGRHPSSPPYVTYRMNLLFHDTSRPPLSLTHHGDWDATWTVAHQLATFLGVPVQNDCTSCGRGGAPATKT